MPCICERSLLTSLKRLPSASTALEMNTVYFAIWFIHVTVSLSSYFLAARSARLRSCETNRLHDAWKEIGVDRVMVLVRMIVIVSNSFCACTGFESERQVKLWCMWCWKHVIIISWVLKESPLSFSLSLCSPQQSVLLSLAECRTLPAHLLSCSRRLIPLAVVTASDVLGGVQM